MTGGPVRRFVAAHLFAVVGEWAATVAVLVLAYDWGGPGAVGPISIAVLTPALVGAPIAANLAARFRVHRVRLGGFGIQAVALGAAAIAAALDAPAPVATAFVMVGLGALNTLRPTGAVLLPSIVRTTRELVSGNLRIAHCDSASALVGPLLAAGCLAIGGPTVVFATCAVGAAVSCAATAWRPAPIARTLVTGTGSGDTRRATRNAFAELRRHRSALGVLGVVSARNVVIGAFDVLLVIVAFDALDLGAGGPGVLSTLIGTGALLSAVLLTFVARRARLRYALGGSLVVTAVICLALAARTETVVVFALLPPLGACLALMDTSSRILLQRSTDPQHLGPLFAVLGLVSGGGQLAGSAIAQGSFALGGLTTALITLGALLAVLAGLTAPLLRSADAQANVPVVEMALLAQVSWLAELPAPMLEGVARAAERVDVAAGREVITQGDDGDVMYVVVDGAFDVVMSGEPIRRAERGDFFGEVALLASVPRTATVTSCQAGELLEIHRAPFLDAIGGHHASYIQATDHVRSLRLEPGMLPAEALERD